MSRAELPRPVVHLKSFALVLLLLMSASGLQAADVVKVPERLLFVSVQSGGAQIYAVNADGSDERALTTGPGENTQPSWSPDGRRIAFTSTRDAANMDVYLMNADGSAQQRLTDHALPDDSPAWSPDGQRIVFRSYRDRRAAFYSMAADGSHLQRLTSADGDKGRPLWAPDGLHIAYEVYGDLGKIELHVMRADGSNDKDVSSAVSKDKKTQPVWSPDGKRLAFVSVKSYGENHIYVVDADGSHAVNLTDSPYISNQPAWSPDGQRIAFVSNRYGDMISRSAGDIYVMNADGSSVVNLTRHTANDDEPSWSSDGQTLYFLSMRNGPPQLHALDLAGGPPRRLTHHGGQDLMFSLAPAKPPLIGMTGAGNQSTGN